MMTCICWRNPEVHHGDLVQSQANRNMYDDLQLLERESFSKLFQTCLPKSLLKLLVDLDLFQES